jgi:hypothetical protein
MNRQFRLRSRQFAVCRGPRAAATFALHERDQGATTHCPAFAIGDAPAASFDHLIGAH